MLQRQDRIHKESEGDTPALVRRASEPPPVQAPHPELKKHASHPPMIKPRCLVQMQEPSLLLQAAVVRRQCSRDLACMSRQSPSSGDNVQVGSENCPMRSSHCPAVRSGPALSCNYCWNTVDERGRILRRKTKYHCPECRTNLCIVPCFHLYHARNTENPPQ